MFDSSRSELSLPRKNYSGGGAENLSKETRRWRQRPRETACTVLLPATLMRKSRSLMTAASFTGYVKTNFLLVRKGKNNKTRFALLNYSALVSRNNGRGASFENYKDS